MKDKSEVSSEFVIKKLFREQKQYLFIFVIREEVRFLIDVRVYFDVFEFFVILFCV